MKFFTRTKIISAIIILVVVIIAGIMYVGGGSNETWLTEKVKKQDITQTVLATGQVVSETDLSLSFKGSGVVQSVGVKVGDKVKAGQILATLDQKDQLASVTSARGTLASAEANYKKVLAGASSEEVVVAQKALDAAQTTLTNALQNQANVKVQQQLAVDNAYKTLLNSTFVVVEDQENEGTGVPTITGTYTGTETGTYTIETYVYGAKGLSFTANGLETGVYGDVQSTPVKMGNRGLYIQFTGNPKPYKDKWTLSIPSTQAPNYTANKNAYDAAVDNQRIANDKANADVASATSALAQAQASLDLKRAAARPADIDAAKAQIISAQGQVQAASAALENTIVRAPANGTITSVDIKVGELASASKEVFILKDVEALHVESNVSEANIAQLKPGQPILLTFDALGPEIIVTGKVQTIDPASTVISGVVNYKITAAIDNQSGVRPGMTANMSIITAQKKQVLVIPQRAVINQDNLKKVRVVKDLAKQVYEEIPVTLGVEADGGVVEVVSGLSEDQEIITFINKK